MRANAKANALIYPDEELTVYPLKLRVEIDLSENLITVFDEDIFFKRYSILDSNLPPDLKAPVSTTIKEKVAWFEDRPINFLDTNYLKCSKWIRTGKIGLFIREVKKDDSQSFGVMVEKADMEELFTILRNGSRVDLVQ
jgi:hypothetical protein